MTLEAFENYYSIAEGEVDEKLEYYYSIILNECGHSEKAKKLWQKIANNHKSDWQKRARFELIKLQVTQDIKVLEQLEDLMNRLVLGQWVSSYFRLRKSRNQFHPSKFTRR